MLINRDTFEQIGFTYIPEGEWNVTWDKSISKGMIAEYKCPLILAICEYLVGSEQFGLSEGIALCELEFPPEYKRGTFRIMSSFILRKIVISFIHVWDSEEGDES